MTERDRHLLNAVSRFTLTTRLVDEISHAEGFPFASPQTLYRRLDRLRKANLIQRDRMLWNGEFYYYLTKRGVAVLQDDQGITFPFTVTAPLGLNIQRHEYDISRYWIKFLSDCRKLQIPVLQFMRDRQFVARIGTQKLIPDGTAILKVRGKTKMLFLELDRSTETSGLNGKVEAVIRQKIRLYQRFARSFKNHPDLKPYKPHSMRVMFVCISESRARNLCAVAKQMGVKNGCVFTDANQFIDVTNPNSAHGWKYRRCNLLAAPIFSYPSRSPPCSLLS